jgi:WD40 repeat protein
MFWNILTVDLQKHKVTYPDWTNAKYQTGRITKLHLLRTKERVYNIDYDDGSKLNNVREEYIRLIIRRSSNYSNSDDDPKFKSNVQLSEGIRVHMKVTKNSRSNSSAFTTYLPGRIIECCKSNTYNIECEGKQVYYNVVQSDLIVGLQPGQLVEAKRPTSIVLQPSCTSWNSTGNTLAVSFGSVLTEGWCNHPGAICCWNLFNERYFNPKVPNHIMDNSISLMICKYHPEIPSLVAAGTYNGDIILWDLKQSEYPIAISPLSLYSHQGPVMQLAWIKTDKKYVNNRLSVDEYDKWILLSIGMDGKVII